MVKAFGVSFGLALGVLALLFAGSAATASLDRAQVSAKGKYKKCAVKKTAKARKKCRRNVDRLARIRRQVKNTWWVDYAGVASRKPRTFVFADYSMGPGPVVSKLKWKKWGYSRATATGVMSEPSMMPGSADSVSDAKIVAGKPMTCRAQFGTRKGARITVYGKVALNFRTAAEAWMGNPGTTLDISGMSGKQVCSRPATD